MISCHQSFRRITSENHYRDRYVFSKFESGNASNRLVLKDWGACPQIWLFVIGARVPTWICCFFMKRLFVGLSEIMIIAFSCENAAQDHPAEKHAILRFHCCNKKTQMNISTQIGIGKWIFLWFRRFQTGDMQIYSLICQKGKQQMLFFTLQALKTHIAQSLSENWINLKLRNGKIWQCLRVEGPGKVLHLPPGKPLAENAFST